MRRILSGNEAIARGVWEAGVRVAAAYPGTPSTEILENLALFPDVYCEWSTNEKVAVDVAVGAAYRRAAGAGDDEARRRERRRRLVLLRLLHRRRGRPGDRLGRRPGDALVAERAGQPALRQVRPRPLPRPGRLPGVPGLRDRGVRAVRAFDTPVLLRTTTRISHSATPVEIGERVEVAADRKKFPRDPAKYVMVPANARGRHPIVEERMRRIAECAETCAAQPGRAARPRPRHHHRGRRLPVRPRGLPGRVDPQARHDLSAAREADPVVRGRRRPAHRHRGARPVHRGRRHG